MKVFTFSLEVALTRSGPFGLKKAYIQDEVDFSIQRRLFGAYGTSADRSSDRLIVLPRLASARLADVHTPSLPSGRIS